MKITVELSDSQLKDICRITGEKKKGPAIRKMVVDALLLKQREEIAQKFIDGKWSTKMTGFEASRAADRKAAKKQASRWRGMPLLIDSSLWIDFSRARSPRSLKQFIAPYILAQDAALAEQIIFEVLRHASDDEALLLNAQFNTIPLLATPVDLWSMAATLGQKCRKGGVSAGSIDLLIVAIALHHDAEIVTFDQDFQIIARTCGQKVKLLRRPGL